MTNKETNKPEILSGPSGEKLVRMGERRLPQKGEFFFDETLRSPNIAGHNFGILEREILRPAMAEEIAAAQPIAHVEGEFSPVTPSLNRPEEITEAEAPQKASNLMTPDEIRQKAWEYRKSKQYRVDDDTITPKLTENDLVAFACSLLSSEAAVTQVPIGHCGYCDTPEECDASGQCLSNIHDSSSSAAPSAASIQSLKEMGSGHICRREECGCNCGVSWSKDWKPVISKHGQDHPECKCKKCPSAASEGQPAAAREGIVSAEPHITRFEAIDLIIPSMKFSERGVFIALEIKPEHIDLRIGGRDMRWSQKTGRITDTGFFVNPEDAEKI